MSKTDKELTVEVVNTFVTAWFSKSTTKSLSGDDLTRLIEDVHKTISTLDKSPEHD